MIVKLTIMAATIMLAACGGNSQKKTTEDTVVQKTEAVDMHNAENSLDYHGVYKGTFPAADCPGIEMTLDLKNEGEFNMRSYYIERDTFDETGTYKVEGNILTLNYRGNTGQDYYSIEEDRLVMLNDEKQPAEGANADCYILRKVK